MNEITNSAALPIMFIADGKNVQISLNGVFDASLFLMKPASLNDDHWWMREVPYIQVTDGITEEIEPDTGRKIRKTDLPLILPRVMQWIRIPGKTPPMK